MCNCVESETWAPIDGQPGYEISDHGNVRSWKSGSPRLLRQQPNRRRGNYLQFSPSQDGRQRLYKTHVTVMATFVGPRPDGAEVRHLDGDVSNNHLTNLAYGTHAENERDKYKHGTRTKFKESFCCHGHEYDEQNTRMYNGIRFCRACARAQYARNAERNARLARERRARVRELKQATQQSLS